MPTPVRTLHSDPRNPFSVGKDWIPENKHDGYRLIVQRDHKVVRLFTRNGNDWTNHYPLIAEAALRNRASSFVIDGEAVLLGVDGEPSTVVRLRARNRRATAAGRYPSGPCQCDASFAQPYFVTPVLSPARLRCVQVRPADRSL
jgi:ATP-dependent DNA ligase